MPRRRELAAYRLLLEAGSLDLGEAVELLRSRLCTTKRTARGIVKRLRRIGAVRLVRRRDGGFTVVPVPPEELLRIITEGYVEARSRRCGDGEGRTLRGQ